jgi:Fic-DOC domain mobile mystery protein B
MTAFEITHPPGATPLDPDERVGLIPDYISTQGELNKLEQKNIQDAEVWIRRRAPREVLNPGFIHELHRRMFGEVWKWAGNARTTEKTIGIDPAQIANQLAHLLADAKYWIENRTYPFDEIAIRFHHRLVQIHVFPNGNGRHARLITDLLLESHDHARFSWGLRSTPTPIEAEGERRTEYVAALRKADQNDFGALAAFVRS